jgi:dTDP-4-amino-4,6-dideoxygalactose transaminase
MSTIYPTWPSYSESEISAVEKVLRSGKVNYWTGTDCRDFEERFASWAGCRHAISLSNGTVALELSLRCLGISQGDEVIVTPLSFFASASCVISTGATPVFADVDPETGNLCAATIKPAITDNTRAVIVVHLGGMPCDMDPIMELAQQYGIHVIEDCAQAHGARYKGRSIGTFGHVAAWSFCQDKIITTGGEGGMVTTNDSALHDRIWSAKDHGKNILLREQTGISMPFQKVYPSFGTNGRMTGMQAAIGVVQLGMIDDWHRKRLANARQLRAGIAEIAGISFVPWHKGFESASYRESLKVDPDLLSAGWTRDRIVRELKLLGAPCTSGAAAELHLADAFSLLPRRHPPVTPAAASLAARSIAFDVHPALQTAHIDEIASSVRAVMQKAAIQGSRVPTLA